MKLSVSREAVPLPIAIISTLYFLISFSVIAFAFSKALGSIVEPFDNSFG